MRKFCILAWLPSSLGEKKVAVNEQGVVLLFNDYRAAADFGADELYPDWEFIVIPILTLVVER